jgi:hypothetical protein
MYTNPLVYEPSCLRASSSTSPLVCEPPFLAPLSANLCRSTFLKRKGGLFKKAHELSVLCAVNVAVIIYGANKKLYQYSSTDMTEMLNSYSYVSLALAGRPLSLPPR